MSKYQQTPHPYLPAIPDDRIESLAKERGIDFVVELIEKRENAIKLGEIDPLRCGFELDCWKDARRLLVDADELLILGGNRSGKTEFACKLAVETLCNIENAVVWCFHSSLATSIELQQPIIRKYLPPEWRDIGKKGSRVNVNWTDKGGFTEQCFVLPNGSRCRFLNYTQNITVLEGGECDMILCDELVPIDWIETLRFRIVTRSGKLIISFTPVRGYSPTVKDYVAGAKILEDRPAELLNPDAVHVNGCSKGNMPYILQPFRKSARVICFHSHYNPFGGYKQIVKMLQGKPSTDIKIRAYGWAEKLEGNVFNKFDDRVHVVRDDVIPDKGTRYVSCDPAGNKNWFIKWYILDDLGRVFLYREFPDRKNYGEWALPSEKADGKAGPAQTLDMGKSIVAYKKIILEAEGWTYDEETKTWDDSKAEKIYERLIDPRMGGAAVPSAEEGTSIISLLEDEQRDKDGNVTGPSLVFIPAPGGQIEEGLQLINDYLDYDNDKPVTALNSPRFFISENCEQTIYAMQEYTGRDGLKGALKDVVDCDRYLFKAGVMSLDGNLLDATGGDYYEG